MLTQKDSDFINVATVEDVNVAPPDTKVVTILGIALFHCYLHPRRYKCFILVLRIILTNNIRK
jgi:hypothetical protein